MKKEPKNMTYKEKVKVHNESEDGLFRGRVKNLARNNEEFNDEDFNSKRAKWDCYEDMVMTHNESIDHEVRKYAKEAARHHAEFNDADFGRFNEIWDYDKLVKEHNKSDDPARRNYLKNLGKWKSTQEDGEKTRHINDEYNEADWNSLNNPEKRYAKYIEDFKVELDNRRRAAIKEKAKRIQELFDENDFERKTIKRKDYTYAELKKLFNADDADAPTRGWLKTEAKNNYPNKFNENHFPRKERIAA